MVKGMKGIVAVHLKALTGNKDGSSGYPGNVAASLANGSVPTAAAALSPAPAAILHPVKIPAP